MTHQPPREADDPSKSRKYEPPAVEEIPVEDPVAVGAPGYGSPPSDAGTG
jgi:hypothetical protein